YYTSKKPIRLDQIIYFLYGAYCCYKTNRLIIQKVIKTWCRIQNNTEARLAEKRFENFVSLYVSRYVRDRDMLTLIT
ncbi:MAG: hypothetical protein KC545_02935, partial [Nitrospira sp.]|nr:hypothetical protein [Nitrospira sp.]